MMRQYSFYTGVAYDDITPDRPLANYNGAEMERDPKGGGSLLCRVLALTFNEETTIFIACDLTFIDRSLVLRLRDELSKRFRLKPEKIMVSATHTHNAPTVCHTFFTGGKPDPLYMDYLVSKVVKAAGHALEARKPALVRPGMAATPSYSGNRRRLREDGGISMIDAPEQWAENLPAEGPEDAETGFLAFDSLEGDPLIFMVFYACHNNCCDTFGGGYYHPDIFGYIAEELEKKYPSLQGVLCLPAPSGNIIWKCKENGGPHCGSELAKTIAESCASSVAASYGKAIPEKVTLMNHKSELLFIPDRLPEESTVCDDCCRGDSEWEMEFARLRYEPEEKAVADRGETTCPVEINAIRVNNNVLITNPAELFLEYGLQIREESPFPVTLIAELSNGYCGYVPTKKAFQRGGYETHRTVYTSRLVKEAGEIISTVSLKLLTDLKD